RRNYPAGRREVCGHGARIVAYGRQGKQALWLRRRGCDEVHEFGSDRGFGLDDTIALVGVAANGASVNGSDQLVVTENRTVVDTLQLSGNNSGLYFLPVPVSGGTDIVSLPDPATVADYLDVPSLYDQIPGGFKISDTAANVVAGLSTLNADSHVAAITVTSGTATLSGNV